LGVVDAGPEWNQRYKTQLRIPIAENRAISMSTSKYHVSESMKTELYNAASIEKRTKLIQQMKTDYPGKIPVIMINADSTDADAAASVGR
jgi:hypothetical protein